MDELFHSQNAKVNNGASTNSNSSINNDDDKNRKKYQAEYDSCSMRQQILHNELTDRKDQLRHNKQRKEATRKTINLLKNEKEEVLRKRRLLDDELELIESHLAEQFDKEDNVKSDESEIIEGVKFVETTMTSLEAQLEKAKILSGQL